MTRVSVETMKIVAMLPGLEERKAPDFPAGQKQIRKQASARLTQCVQPLVFTPLFPQKAAACAEARARGQIGNRGLKHT